MSSVAMIVPSRGRPDSVNLMAAAWEMTDANRAAHLVWVIDQDDPGWARYMKLIGRHQWMRVLTMPEWMPMVPKLNKVALAASEVYDVVGFMGDDHLPRTADWVSALAAAHINHGPGIFYGRDGFKDARLPTWWAMSAQVIARLGCMVPGGVEHLYCDNIVLEMGKAARVLRYLPSVLIEHMHPVVGKADWDEGHIKVNSDAQYERDRRAFLAWLETDRHRHGTMLRELARGV